MNVPSARAKSTVEEFSIILRIPGQHAPESNRQTGKILSSYNSAVVRCFRLSGSGAIHLGGRVLQHRSRDQV